jgi:fumarate reductase flavoprotein subunit
MTAARVTDLYVAACGDISGVRIARPDGGIEDLGVNALVLACCGYGGNRTLVAEPIPEMANGKYFGHDGNRGDAVRWGVDLGAAMADLSAYQGLGTLAEPQAVVVPHPLLLEGGWLVNADGRRFTHENANISGLCVPVIAQPQSIAWVIFDEQRHRACLRHSIEQRQLLEIGALRSAASLDELATLCRLPAAALAAEFQHIAASANAHRPDRFGREFHTEPLLTAPFYAVRVTGALFHTQGGLVVDSDARVCRAAGGKFANLFAGGGAARGISGPTVRGYLPGAGLCMAMTLGRVAGRAAAQQARRSL